MLQLVQNPPINTGVITNPLFVSLLYIPNRKSFTWFAGTTAYLMSLGGTIASVTGMPTGLSNLGYGKLATGAEQMYLATQSGGVWSIFRRDYSLYPTGSAIYSITSSSYNTGGNFFVNEATNEIYVHNNSSVLVKLNGLTGAILSTYSFLPSHDMNATLNQSGWTLNVKDFDSYAIFDGSATNRPIYYGKLSQQSLSTANQNTTVRWFAWDTDRNVYRQFGSTLNGDVYDFVPATPVATSINLAWDRPRLQGGGANATVQLADTSGVGVPFKPLTVVLTASGGGTPNGLLTISPLSELSKLGANLNIALQTNTTLSLITDVNGYAYFTYLCSTTTVNPDTITITHTQ